jgi:hypothetical protein
VGEGGGRREGRRGKDSALRRADRSFARWCRGGCRQQLQHKKTIKLPGVATATAVEVPTIHLLYIHCNYWLFLRQSPEVKIS